MENEQEEKILQDNVKLSDKYVKENRELFEEKQEDNNSKASPNANSDISGGNNNSTVYIPSILVNSNYLYKPIDNYIVVYTNNNCYNNYSQQYCDCYSLYPNYNYVISDVYSCRVDNVTGVIPYSKVISSNRYYRNDMPSILLMTFILLILCFYFPYKIISRLFGRWLKW